jgi:outer membrane protein, multidrug efflux system
MKYAKKAGMFSWFRLNMLALATALTGCTPLAGPDYHPPSAPAPQQFANALPVGMSADSTEISWWQVFNDAELNELVAEGLQSNPDLKIAMANLRQARALRFQTKFDLFPTVTASAAEKTQKFGNGQFGSGYKPGPEFDLLTTGFDATWEVDFFGRIRRSIEAQVSQTEATEAVYRDAIVSLVSELARNYFELRGTQHQLEVAENNAENQRATLKYTKVTLAGGRGTALDVARAEEQLNSTLASIPPLEGSIRHFIHRLAVLLGKTPEQLYARLEVKKPIPNAPNIVAIGDPKTLLQRRPDIRVAERNLAASTAKIGVVMADFFPRVTFNGSLSLQANTFVGLGASGSDSYSFGPSIRWAAFDMGRVYARMKVADAQVDADMANYQKTVLRALEETENALLDYGKLQVRRDYFRQAVASAEKSARLSRLRYKNGLFDFLAVLDAERRLLESQDRLAQTETETATALVAVYKALGGGWEWDKNPDG